MNLNSNRTLAMVAIIAVVLLILLNPQWLSYTLNILQSVATIALAVVATIYLWKRL